MNTDTTLTPFKAIVDFIEQLEEFYGEKHRPLRLYNVLIGKTEIRHKQAMKKHIENMRDFCIENREGITEKDFNLYKVWKLRYSEKVYVDFKEIFNFVEEDKDKDVKKAIQKHLLYLSALLDPTGNAKEILKKNTGSEGNFLSNIIGKIEENVDPDANPMEAMNSILGSGIFTDMMSSMSEGLESGSLDLGKLMGSVQNMVSELGEKANTMNSTVSEEDGEEGEEGESKKPKRSMPPNMPDISGMSDMLNTLTKNMPGDGEEGEMPDISKMLGPMLSGLSEMMPPGMMEKMTESMGGADGSGPTIPGIGKIPGGSAGISNMMNLVSNMGGSDLSIEEQINQQYASAKAKESSKFETIEEE